MFHTHVFLVLVAAAWVAAEQPAVASCLISNQTTYAFAIDSGSAANQRVHVNLLHIPVIASATTTESVRQYQIADRGGGLRLS